MVLDLEDLNTSGVNNFQDKIGITVFRNAGGVWYSNNWMTSKTVATNICGGDLTVTGTTTALLTSVNTITSSGAMEKSAEIKSFNVNVYPNPSEKQFTLILDGATGEKINVTVYDVMGRQIKRIVRVGNFSPIQFGEELKAGAYIAEVRQGDNRKILRLVKQ